MKYEIIKKTIFLLALATFPATAQRSQDDLERDLRRIEGKIDQIEFDQDQREARKKLAEEERILALPLDEDIKQSSRRYYSSILSNPNLSQAAKNRIVRVLLLGLAKIQDERNTLRR